jgi:hypothetical protein
VSQRTRKKKIEPILKQLGKIDGLKKEAERENSD